MMLIELVAAGKHYVDSTFNFTINSDEFVIIDGANGIGKTTLLKLIIGYISPDYGTVIKRAKHIAFLAEKTELPNNILVSDFLITIARINKGEVDYNLVKKLDIPLNKYIKHLSKGNKQKLAIASKLIGLVDLLVLDEPFDGLDARSIDIIGEYLNSIKNKTAIILVSHTNTNIKSIADRIVVL